MVEINTLIEQGKTSSINELELGRYTAFLSSSYKENLEHSKSVVSRFPRWSIISAYYAMHDVTKLFIASKLRLKVEREVHATTVEIMKESVRNKELLEMLEIGYKEFLSFASDLDEAKKERVKVQYYTGTPFMRKEYEKRAKELIARAEEYIMKMGELLK